MKQDIKQTSQDQAAVFRSGPSLTKCQIPRLWHCLFFSALLLILILMTSHLTGCGSKKDAGNQVVVIGLDGATWEMLQPWIDQGLLPNLAAFQAASAWGELSSVVPYLSPSAWTSAVTGVNPGKHAIYAFMRRIPGQTLVVNETAKSRRAQPIWNMIREKGKRVLLLNIPMTDPPDEVNGLFISGFPHQDDAGFTYPEELQETLIDYDLDMLAMQLVPDREDSTLHAYMDQMETRKNITLDWLQNEEFDLMWVVFTGTDRIQHTFWVYSDPENPHYDPERALLYKDFMLDFWKAQDKAFGEVLAAIDPGATTLVLSDHGFGPMRFDLKVQNYLRRAGGRLQPDETNTVFCLHPNDATRLYISTAGRDPGARLSRGEARIMRDKTVADLRAATDPRTGTPICEQVLVNEEVFSGTYAEKGPDIIVIPAPGYFMVMGEHESLPEDEYLVPHSKKLSAWHRMNGIYMVKGDNIQAENRLGRKGDEFSLFDIVPTTLYLMGEPIPDELDGTIMQQIINPVFFQENPPLRRDALEEDYRPMTPEEMNSLKSMPYIG